MLSVPLWLKINSQKQSYSPILLYHGGMENIEKSSVCSTSTIDIFKLNHYLKSDSVLV